MSTNRVRALRRPDAAVPASPPIPWGVQRLSWRGFPVRKNVSNGRRKLLNARTWNDDAVTAAVSFLSDTQESASLIFPEFDIEVLALNLQFSRLDDVIHFALRAPSLGSRSPEWKKNPQFFEYLLR